MIGDAEVKFSGTGMNKEPEEILIKRGRDDTEHGKRGERRGKYYSLRVYNTENIYILVCSGMIMLRRGR